MMQGRAVRVRNPIARAPPVVRQRPCFQLERSARAATTLLPCTETWLCGIRLRAKRLPPLAPASAIAGTVARYAAPAPSRRFRLQLLPLV